MRKIFYGWWITAAVFVSFGITVGVPYYGMPFFYDYFIREFGWTRADITLGFPLGALLTLWVGPALVHRYSPRRMMLIGTLLTFLAFLGFGMMGVGLAFYYLLWAIYRGGNIFCGPIPYQVMLSEWFRQKRGTAMAVAYLGVGVFGGISARYIAQPLTEAYGFRAGLIGIGALMFLAWPIAIFVMKDRPADIGAYPDGAPAPEAAAAREEPKPFGYLLRQPAFWLLLAGSFASIGAIGSINQHMKLIFLDGFAKAGVKGPHAQTLLNNMFSTSLLWIGLVSNAGRILMGYLADRFSKKRVMVATYFLAAGSIPLLFHLAPPSTPWLFTVVFGLAMGADYMLIPLAAAEQFGLASLARTMSIILPADTVGQACVPYLVARIRQNSADYGSALAVVFALALAGAVAILLLPKAKEEKRVELATEARK